MRIFFVSLSKFVCIAKDYPQSGEMQIRRRSSCTSRIPNLLLA